MGEILYLEETDIFMIFFSKSMPQKVISSAFSGSKSMPTKQTGVFSAHGVVCFFNQLYIIPLFYLKVKSFLINSFLFF